MNRYFFFFISMVLVSCSVSDHDNPMTPEKLTLKDSLNEIGFPIVYVTTENAVEPTCDPIDHPEGMAGSSITNVTKIPGRVQIERGGVKLYDSNDYVKGVSGMTIKIRGNGSAHEAKKPYKIKLEKKADLLCRDDKSFADKDWILVKDPYMSTAIGLKMNELFEREWTPHYQYVNLIFNGDYRGLYLLMESVKRNTDCRLKTSKTGYVFEYDVYWWNEDYYIKSTFPYFSHYTFKYPDSDDITQEQADYFKAMIAKTEESIKNGSYDDYIEVMSFVDWVLAQDILGNLDAWGSNIYLMKDDDTEKSKVKMANMWDFDGIARTDNDWAAIHNRAYWGYLFQYSDFLEKYRSRWLEKQYVCDEMINWLQNFENSDKAKRLQMATELDKKRWNNSNWAVKDNISKYLNWFSQRKKWMNEHVSRL